jgi:hypothetical protein
MDFRQKTIFFALFLLLLPLIGWGQYRYKKFTYLGIETGLKSEFYRVTDTGTELYHKQGFQSGIQGIFAEQELNRYCSISTGFYFTKYNTNFKFERDNGINTYQPMRTFFIPLRFHVNIPLFYGIPEVRLVPSLGVNSVFNLSDNQVVVRGRIAPDLSDTYSGRILYDLKSTYFLGEAGLNIDMMFAKGLIISVGGAYCQGIQNVAKVELEYQIGREVNQGTLTSRGNYYVLRLGGKYPISRWWRKKK